MAKATIKEPSNSALNTCWPLWTGLTGAFFLIHGFQIWRHVLWRDEFQAWLIALESHNLWDLLANRAQEGNPGLWHFCLWLIQLFTHHPAGMQVFHLCIATATVALILNFSPFSLIAKLCLICSYFLSFEYVLISRSYVLGVFFVILTCVLKSRAPHRIILRGICLGLISTTSPYGIILSLTLLLNEIFTRDIHWQFLKVRETAPLLVGYSALTLFSVWALVPWEPTIVYDVWHWNWNLDSMISDFILLLRVFIPIPQVKMEFWNSSILDSLPWVLQATITLSILGGILSVLWHSPKQVKILLLGLMGIWAFTHFKFQGTYRHQGAAFILFIACAWFAIHNTNVKISRAWVPILLLQTLAGLSAGIQHELYPFSEAKEVASWLHKRPDLLALPTLGDIDYCASTVCGYLSKPIYYMWSDSPVRFVRWTAARLRPKFASILDKASSVSKQTSQSVLLILSYPIPAIDLTPQGGRVTELAHFTSSVVPDEKFFLYRYDNQ